MNFAKADNHEINHQDWHMFSVTDTINKLGTNVTNGLSSKEAEERLKHYGYNQLISAPKISLLTLFLNQFKNSLVIILIIATGLSGFLGHTVEAVAIGIIILFAVLLSFVQEWRAGQALEALQKMAAPTAFVFRSGLEREIPANELVPGDVILISSGDKVPADARLIEALNLKTEEAALTGESLPVDKQSDLICAANTELGDRYNMIFAGTTVIYGRGRALVVTTGMQTEFGHIAKILQTVEKEKTPLEKNLDRLGKIMTKLALIIVLGIVILGLFRGQPFLELIVFGVALAVAVVPEALPAVVTISLAIGVQRMVKQHALVRYLPAVETLGCTSIICSDKTGTLTKDEMTVRKIFINNKTILDVTGTGYEPIGKFLLNNQPYSPTDNLLLLLKAAALASDARLAKTGGSWDLKGDPTEGALVVAAAKAGLQKELLDEQFKRIAEIPFSSENKRMSTLHQSPEGTIAYSKGAAEIILAACDHYQTEVGIKLLTEEVRKNIIDTIHSFAKEALRVIGLAYVPTTDLEQTKDKMIFLGLAGMIDPPRPEAKSAIKLCQQAGIKIMMITGDHPETAKAIASELDLLTNESLVITGTQLTAMSEVELEKQIEQIAVCARVSPEHKLRIVQALQRRGHVVAMTGDGINDAPAIKQANIGIAMGITGTDVSREAAALVLTDDNFASIVAAVKEGRIIFNNIKKYLMYLLSSNIGEIGLMVGAALVGLPLPLSAVQILYINLATDGLPALALAVDPPEQEIMRHLPRRVNDGVFTKSTIALIVTGGIWSALVNILLFTWAYTSGYSLSYSMTMVFTSLVLIEFFKAYNFRSDYNSVFRNTFANRWLNRSVIWELFLLGLVIYLPFLQVPFKTVSLSYIDWLLILIVAFTVVPILETAKWLLRKQEINNHLSVVKN